VLELGSDLAERIESGMGLLDCPFEVRVRELPGDPGLVVADPSVELAVARRR
jgi:hypothetical protein